MERRKNIRIDMKLKVEIQPEHGEVAKGITRNISFSGVIIDLEETCHFKPGDRCRLLLQLSSEENLQIGFNSRIVHINGTSIGIEFVSVEGLEAFQHFKNMMILNSPDPDLILQELEKEPGLHSQQ